ncbi:MAG: chorismate synthase [Kiritimatiellaeota bacterium]|nr:chorismate synthase [Kiritimatiellota bacterium]
MLRYLTAGESHGPALTAILDGMPAGLPLTEGLIAADLARRQLPLGAGDRMKIETDHAQILSGVMEGLTTGAPIALLITNADHANWAGRGIAPYPVPRPGHADLAAAIKYGYSDIRPALERASARETAARVAVGAICRAFLAHFGINVIGRITQVAHETDPDAFARVIAAAQDDGETLGGIIEVCAENVPPGLGSHVQADRRLDARLAQALMSIQAVKGVEIGDAFANAARPGTQAHDPIRAGLMRPTNRCGGIEGGISNGSPVVARLAMKPIPTTLKPQPTVNLATGQETATAYERSDICPLPRAVVVAEAAAAFVLADALIEKLGGDSLAEMAPRMEQARAAAPALDGQPHVFWPCGS